MSSFIFLGEQEISKSILNPKLIQNFEHFWNFHPQLLDLCWLNIFHILLFQYSINQTVALSNGDRIGWTFEGNVGPICFQYLELHRTFLFQILDSKYLEVGQTAVFDKVNLPSQFSIATLVDGSKCFTSQKRKYSGIYLMILADVAGAVLGRLI